MPEQVAFFFSLVLAPQRSFDSLRRWEESFRVIPTGRMHLTPWGGMGFGVRFFFFSLLLSLAPRTPVVSFRCCHNPMGEMGR